MLICTIIVSVSYLAVLFYLLGEWMHECVCKCKWSCFLLDYIHHEASPIVEFVTPRRRKLVSHIIRKEEGNTHKYFVMEQEVI